MKITKDLTVVGAGFAGICTAIAAARQGLKVALINDRNVLGGNASSEHRVHVNGAAEGNKTFYSREAGIADELKMFVLRKNPKYNIKQEFHLNDMALLEKVLAEKNIELFLGTCVYDCETENGKITKVYAAKSNEQKDFVFESPLFCDASGDGILAYKAGCEYKIGRESKYEFDESLAPETADNAVMGSCILFSAKHTGEPVKYTKPSFAYDLVKDDKIKYFNQPETGRNLPVVGGRYNGLWWLEYGYPHDTIKDSDKIDFELKKLIYGYWDYIKNSGNYPDSEDMAIDWIAPYASKRESRRFIGDYILKQSDIQNRVDFADAVATGGWSLDIHDYKGIYGNGPTSAFGEVNSMYNIPLSIMYSKDAKNLFFAGRIASCTHIAMGSVRVMQTLGAMGQAVGTAAYLCKKYNCEPRVIKNNHIAELQNILQKNGQYILGKKEDCGYASGAKITASSTKKMQNTYFEKEFCLNNNLIFTIPISKSFTNKIEIKIKNTQSAQTVLKYNIYNEQGNTINDKGELLKQCEITVEKDFDGYLPLSLDVDLSYERIFVELEKNEDLSVFGTENKTTAAPTYFNLEQAKQENSTSFCFKCVENAPDLYSAKNVANGYSRPYKGANCWVSENTENQWLELEFDKPIDFSNIQIYFNPQFETDHFNNPIKQLITDYKISVFGKDGVDELDVKDNYNGQNSFFVDYKNVTKIRFDFIKNNGAKEFEVFAVKVF